MFDEYHNCRIKNSNPYRRDSKSDDLKQVNYLDYFHPGFKLSKLGTKYAFLGKKEKVELIESIVDKAYKLDEPKSKFFIIWNTAQWTPSSHSLVKFERSQRRGRDHESLLPKGNINKSLNFLERKIKENHIGKSKLVYPHQRSVYSIFIPKYKLNLIYTLGTSLKKVKFETGAVFKKSKKPSFIA